MNVVSIEVQDLIDLQAQVNAIPKLQREAALAYGYLLLAADNSHDYTVAQVTFFAQRNLENLLTPEQRKHGLKVAREHLKTGIPPKEQK